MWLLWPEVNPALSQHAGRGVSPALQGCSVAAQHCTELPAAWFSWRRKGRKGEVRNGGNSARGGYGMGPPAPFLYNKADGSTDRAFSTGLHRRGEGKGRMEP